MRFLHHRVSFDANFIRLVKERLDSESLTVKVLTVVELLLQFKFIENSLRCFESWFALCMFLPIPLVSGMIFRLVSNHQGGVGLYLRSLWVRQKAAYVGRNVLVESNVTLANVQELELHDFSYLDKGVQVMCPAKIGRHCHLATGVLISGGGRIEVEDYASIGMHSVVLTSTDSPRKGFRASGPMVPLAHRNVVRRTTILRRDAFTGPLTLIFPGAVMDVGSVLAGGSVLRRSTKAWTVYHGNPAVAVSQREPVAES